MFNAEPVGFYFSCHSFYGSKFAIFFFSLFFLCCTYRHRVKKNNNAIVLSWFGNCDEDMNSFGRICHN